MDREALVVAPGLERVLALAVLLVQADLALGRVVLRLRVRLRERLGLLGRRVVVGASNIRRRRKAR